MAGASFLHQKKSEQHAINGNQEKQHIFTQWIATTNHPKPRGFVIEKEHLTSLTPNFPDQDAYVLYVFENGKNTHDYMQDTLEIAMKKACEDFGAPPDGWQKVARFY